MKKVSLNDIAKSLGVSKALVSMVLNHHGDKNGISQETQKRVWARARELNYQPNQIARGLRLGRSETLGLIVSDISNSFYARIARKVEDTARQHGYNLIFCSSDEDEQIEEKLINMMRERQVDGLILSTTQHNGRLIEQLRRDRFPFVLIDRYLQGVEANSVTVDNFQGAYDATRHLLRGGFKRIALLKILPNHLSTIRDRALGYEEALHDGGVTVDRALIREIAYSNINEEVYAALHELMLPPHNIQAVITTNNSLATACLGYMNEAGMRIPQDLALVSFDDIDLFKYCYPPVTAVAQPVDELGERAVKMLLELIVDGEKAGVRSVVLSPKLIKRRSCGSFLRKINN